MLQDPWAGLMQQHLQQAEQQEAPPPDASAPAGPGNAGPGHSLADVFAAAELVSSAAPTPVDAYRVAACKTQLISPDCRLDCCYCICGMAESESLAEMAG